MNIRNLSQLFIFAAVLTTLCSCAGGSPAFVYSEGDTIRFSYSRLITMVRYDGFTKVEMTNPWDTSRLLATYILTPKPENYTSLADPAHGVSVVKTPLQNSLVFSSVHCALLAEMGKAEAISGVCDIQYIHTLSHPVTDCGSSMSPNMERIIQLHPSAMLVSPYENRTGYDRLQQVGIPIIECADYMETTPLGRADWLRFYGRLLGKQREADSIFAAVESRYNSMKATVAGIKTRPTVVTEMKIGSTWYVAGKNSTVGILISDAGGDYVFSDVAGSGAVPYNPEQVLQRAHKADFWLIKYNQATDMTMQELAQAWASNRFMEAYRQGNVFGCNLGKTHFFEETPFHPDVLLREFINILHPGTLPEATNKYYKRL